MGKGLFKPARHKWLADVISFESPAEARRSAKRLVRMVRRAGRGKALTIIRALNYASNRAKASAKRKSLSKKERRELKTISKIYRKAQKEASKIYAQRFGD